MVWLAIVLFIVALLALVILKQRNAGASADDFPYILESSLFSPAERSFLGVLDQCFGSEYRILGKVRIADAITVRKGTAKPRRQRAFNRISSKHFDFLLCSATELKPLCAIELDDQSHARANRQARDTFVRRACQAAGLPLANIPAQHAYVAAEIRQSILAAIADSQRTAAEATSADLPLHEMHTILVEEPNGPNNESQASAQSCPRCGGEMVKRRAKSGENAGKEFWGCTKFPVCRGAVFS